ncbi:hypothetical protein AB0F15_26085 [Amycolatopsis sp. NPDC026612]|uniref:hypothetical protein n=1 Tax=Amycolatopsis sp. NPDC026612 TaxID=3155466 RepID=UPI0033C43674
MSKREGHSIARSPAGELRPDLRIPLQTAADDGPALLPVLARLGEPRFAEAYRGAWRRLALIAGVVASQFLVAAWVRPWIVAVAAAATLDLIVRVTALKLLEHRQRAFEQRWLDVQSGVLRTATFEVLRLRVKRRGYDLTRQDEVSELLRRRDTERASPLKVEFGYPMGTRTAVETVHLDLADAALVTAAGARRVRIRFPEARYHAQPSMDRLGWRYPSRTTFWVLGSAILSAVPPGTPTPDPSGGSAVSASGA